MTLMTRRGWLLILASVVACGDSRQSSEEKPQVETVTLAVDGMT